MNKITVISVITILISITAITISYVAEKRIMRTQESNDMTFRRAITANEEVSLKKLGLWPTDKKSWITVEIIGQDLIGTDYEVKAVIWTYDKKVILQ